MNTGGKKIVMLGATGAVGSEVLKSLLQSPQIEQLTLLGRKRIEGISAGFVRQEEIDIFDAPGYQPFVAGHDTAICTLGVGEPSKMKKEEFVKIDKTAVLDFAKLCRQNGVQHFELLASVGVNPKSNYFYLKVKGELVEELKALKFDRLSIFQPSMILTPTNRYGISQAITLKVWPLLKPILIGGWRKFRGIKVDILGRAMARNIFRNFSGYEILQWDDFIALTK